MRSMRSMRSMGRKLGLVSAFPLLMASVTMATPSEEGARPRTSPARSFTPLAPRPAGAPPVSLGAAICISNDGDECHCGSGKLCSAGDHGCACLPVGS